jgi:hypothetical protein
MRRIPLILCLMLGCLGSGPWGAAAGVRIDVQVGVPAPPLPPPVIVTEPQPIVVEVRPQLVLVPGMPVYYAPDMPYTYFVHAGIAYVFHEGRWFRARTHRGPWTAMDVRHLPAPIRRVPVAYYRVPPGHWPPPGRRHRHGKPHHRKHHHEQHDHDDD